VQFNDGTAPLGTPVTISGGLATFNTSTLSVGTHSITAVYSGDANDTAATSTALIQTVNRATSNVTLTSSLNPSNAGQSVTFTAKVVPATATGTVTFQDGTTALGTPVALTGGTATFTSSTLAVGTHPISAVYGGDANNTGGTSPVVSQVVNRVNAGVTLTSSLNPSIVGQAVTFTASVTPTSATGTVQFRDGAANLGAPVTLSAGTATLPVSNLSVGTHSITAVYSGDANNTTNTSTPVSQVVNRINASVALSSSLNPSTVGQNVTFTAGLTPTTATGNVTFLDGTTALATQPSTGGVATLATATLSVGSHPITASYAGDANDTPATSAAVAQTVNRINSAIALASSGNPSTFGQTVTFTATITPNSATGSVQFLDGTTPLGAAVAVSGGVAQLPISTLAVGNHSITAAYGGDASHTAITSTPVVQTVNRANSSVVVTSPANPASVGQAVTFTATVTPKATGTVQFSDGTAPLGTPVPLTSTGVANFTTSALLPGAHSIIAAYSGDANTLGSSSPAFTETITKVNSSVALTSSTNPSTVGQSVAFAATVTPNTATGTVQFIDGTANLGAAVPLSTGGASLSTPNLTVGTHSITARYSGDANTNTSTSTPVSQVVSQVNATVVVTSSANPSTAGQAVTFTARITPATATGTVTFRDGTTILGTPATVIGGAATVNANLTPGTHSITASYSGDTNDTAATSPAFTQTVNQATSTVLLVSSANPSAVGQAVTFRATVTPATATGTVGFKDPTGLVSLSAALTSGVANVTATNLTLGAHPITATYGGDANTTGSTSAPLTQNVRAASTVTVTATSNPANNSFNFTVRVSPTSATGTVQLKDGANNLGGLLQLSGGVATFGTGLSVGTHAITATYSGDANTAPGTSPVVTLNVG
jgi:hypothetical protein